MSSSFYGHIVRATTGEGEREKTDTRGWGVTKATLPWRPSPSLPFSPYSRAHEISIPTSRTALVCRGTGVSQREGGVLWGLSLRREVPVGGRFYARGTFFALLKQSKPTMIPGSSFQPKQHRQACQPACIRTKVLRCESMRETYGERARERAPRGNITLP